LIRGVRYIVNRPVDCVKAEAYVVRLKIGCVDTEMTESFVGNLWTSGLGKKIGKLDSDCHGCGAGFSGVTYMDGYMESTIVKWRLCRGKDVGNYLEVSVEVDEKEAALSRILNLIRNFVK